jgi:hypothetical protein
MEYSKIVAVTKLPGLYELINSKNDGAIVRSLEDQTTKFVSSRIHNFSHLESIEIYTVRDNVNLVDILKAMDASGEKLPEEKDNDGIKKYFEKVYADLDFDRVYTSDLKKMVKWFSILKKNKIDIKLSEPVVEAEEEQKPVAVSKVIEEKPKVAKKSVAVKEEAPKKEAPKKESPKKEEPKKKAAIKEKEKPKEKAPAKSASKEKPKEKTKVKAAEKEKPKKAATKKKN